MKTLKRYINCNLSAVIFIMILSCDSNNSIISQKLVGVQCTHNIIVHSDTIFNNELLNRPILAKRNPVNNNIYVLDISNTCIYVFSLNGKYIRKIGRLGQGPGEFIRPYYIDFDSEGSLYVVDSGNVRIDIFNKDGEYTKMIRTKNIGKKITVVNNNEILFNSPAREYFITIINNKGDVINDIGKLKKYKTGSITFAYSEGLPFKNNAGNYVIFLYLYPKVLEYNGYGELIQEKMLIDELETKEYIDPNKLKGDGVLAVTAYHDIVYYKNKYYILKFPIEDISNNFSIYILDNNYKKEKRYNLPVPEGMPINKSYLLTNLIKFDVIDENRFLFPYTQYATVYEYSSITIEKK